MMLIRKYVGRKMSLLQTNILISKKNRQYVVESREMDTGDSEQI